MRKGFIVTLAAWLTGAGLAAAQPPAPVAVVPPSDGAGSYQPIVDPSAPDGGCRPAAPACGCCPSVDAPVCGPRFWGGAEYLLWWVKDAPAPVPLVTTGPSVGRNGGAGVLGASGTTTLLGGDKVGFGPFSGGRFTLGAWIDPEQRFGLEGSGFFLAQQSRQQTVSSSGLPGSPNLGVPYFNLTTGLEDSAPLSNNTGAITNSGLATLTASSRLWGAELNALWTLTDPCSPLQVHLLGGFRYVNLKEDLSLDTTRAGVAAPGNFETTTNDFGTSNNFYGGQIGARADYAMGRFTVQATAKVALGDMEENVRIDGSDTMHNGLGQATTFPGGFFALPSNMGSFHKSSFACVPEADLKVGYRITDHIQAFAGYSFLYLSDVVRPGDQMEHALNPSQSLGRTLTGPVGPLPQTNSTDFWAQGVNFGLEFRF